MTKTDDDWARLGRALTARRKALGYEKRLPFARDAGLSHDRALSDLENARRQNFEPATIAQVEQVYRWKSGSVVAVLNGHDPTPIDETVGPAPQDDGVLLSMPPEALAGLGPAEREEVIAAARLTALRAAREIRRRVDDETHNQY